MLVQKSTPWALALPPVIQLLLLLLQLDLFHSISAEGDDSLYKECPNNIFEDSTRCNSPGIYYANIDGKTCRTMLNQTRDDCPKGQLTFQINTTVEVDGESQLGRELPDCIGSVGSSIDQTNPSSASHCYMYKIPVCEEGKYELTIYTVGGTDATNQGSDCHDIKIDGKTVSKVLYHNMLEQITCPRTEVIIPLKVNKELTELSNWKTQKFRLIAEQFSLGICFNQCGNKSGTLQIAGVAMAKLGGGGQVKECEMSEAYSNCKHYNEMVSAKCWLRGCQYSLRDMGRCVTGTLSCEARDYKKCICSNRFCENLDTGKCSPEPPIFDNKLSCRRANTYYAYHPKTLCYSEVDSGDCTATATYAVNLNGGALTDQNGITYIAHANSGFRNHDNAFQAFQECDKIDGVSHAATLELYAKAIGGDEQSLPNRGGTCIYYPIPICQDGEYMLTIKMTDGHFDKPNERCSEARINRVPIMTHMDPFALAGNKKCGKVDAVLMFLAEGGEDNNPKSGYTLHLKGHLEPIKVEDGKMELGFCIGWECSNDPNFVASAFTLERLGKGTKECKRG